MLRRGSTRFFDTPAHAGWPPQLTRLEHTTVKAANYNHWWLLEVHRARMADVKCSLRMRPFDVPATVLASLKEMFGPTTAWHPRDRTSASPHEGHRQVLGRYDAWFNRLVHGLPFAPVGIYLFLPVPLLWSVTRAWSQVRASDADQRARGAVLCLLLFQIAFVVLTSTMLTALEEARTAFRSSG